MPHNSWPKERWRTFSNGLSYPEGILRRGSSEWTDTASTTQGSHDLSTQGGSRDSTGGSEGENKAQRSSQRDNAASQPLPRTAEKSGSRSRGYFLRLVANVDMGTDTLIM